MKSRHLQLSPRLPTEKEVSGALRHSSLAESLEEGIINPTLLASFKLTMGGLAKKIDPSLVSRVVWFWRGTTIKCRPLCSH